MINFGSGLEPTVRREMTASEMDERGIEDETPVYQSGSETKVMSEPQEDPIAVLWRDTQDRAGFDTLAELVDALVDDDVLRSHFVRAHRMPWVGSWVEITREVETEVEERLYYIQGARSHDSAGCGMQRP